MKPSKLTDELAADRLTSDIGHKAKVERHNLQDKAGVTKANKALQDIGQGMLTLEPSLKGAIYTGSAAVHYFQYPLTAQPVFVNQASTIGTTHEPLIQMGITDLRNELMQLFGRAPERKRSGF